MMIRFYCDDGSTYDPRLAKLLEKYTFSGIFYIAPFYAKYPMMTINEIKELSVLHEIGGHTLNHKLLTRVTKEEQLQEILEGKNEVEDIIQKKITKFAYPRGWYNDEVVDSARKGGFTECRTMKQGSTDIPKDLFRVPVSVHFYPGRWQEWEAKYQEAKRKDGYFGVVCHAHELEKYTLWDLYENMLKYIYADINA